MSRLTENVAAAGAAMLRVRWLVRAPIWLYRTRLGFLFGTRLLMLEHTGRKTGARRYVVLEIVARPAPGTFVVASGFGAKAQWFRNIVANPHVTVYLGSHRPRPAEARILNPGPSSAVLADHAAAHPCAWRTLRPVFETTLGAQIDDHATLLPLVALDLDDPGNDIQVKHRPARHPGQKPKDDRAPEHRSRYGDARALAHRARGSDLRPGGRALDEPAGDAGHPLLEATRC